MASKDSIKVVAPANNPHICYIPKEYEYKISYVKKRTKMSLYRIICESAGRSLRTKDDIQKFKKELRNLGYKTIGEWVTCIIDHMYKNGCEEIPKPIKKEN